VSFMIEISYPMPRDDLREKTITQLVSFWGGQLTYREETSSDASKTVCLTYEFVDRNSAELAATHMRRQGEHVDGPQDYGPDEPPTD
jgi:hypothetical protein